MGRLIPLLLLTGCAICRPHPQACMIGAGIIATSVAISVNHGDNRTDPAPRRWHLNENGP
jgi:hypothetical protein